MCLRTEKPYLGVDGAADAVGELSIQLRQLVAGVHTGVGDVPHSGGLHNVPDHKLPDRLQKKTSYKTQFEF